MDSFRKGENLLRGELVREQINKLKKCPISEQFFLGGGERGGRATAIQFEAQRIVSHLETR